MAVNHEAVLRFASIRADVPPLCGGGDQHFARRGAGLAQRQPRPGNAAAAAGPEVINLRIGGCLLDVHLLPIHAQLLGKNHRQGRVDTLAHLRFSQHQSDAIIRRDPHPRVKRIGSLLLLILSLIGKRASSHVEPNHQRGATPSAFLQEVTAVYDGSSCHGTPRSKL